MIARDRAAGLTYEALSTLNDIMGNHHDPPGARIRAALAILQRAETMPPPAPQPLPGYAPELPIPQCYSPEDHAPDKIENLAQSAQPAAAPDSPEIPKPNRSFRRGAQPSPLHNPDWRAPWKVSRKPAPHFKRTSVKVASSAASDLSRIGPRGEGKDTRKHLKALSANTVRIPFS